MFCTVAHQHFTVHPTIIFYPLLSITCLQFEYDDWLTEQCGHPPIEEWRKLMYAANAKNKDARPERYRDEWNDDDLVAQASEDFKKYL